MFCFLLLIVYFKVQRQIKPRNSGCLPKGTAKPCLIFSYMLVNLQNLFIWVQTSTFSETWSHVTYLICALVIQYTLNVHWNEGCKILNVPSCIGGPLRSLFSSVKSVFLSMPYFMTIFRWKTNAKCLPSCQVVELKQWKFKVQLTCCISYSQDWTCWDKWILACPLYVLLMKILYSSKLMLITCSICFKSCLRSEFKKLLI